jgi:hypothetical protein
MARPCRNVVQYQWSAVVFTGVRVGWLDVLALILFKFTIPRVKFDVVNFRTFHPFCNKCLAQAEKDERVGDAMSGLAVGAGLIAGIALLWGLNCFAVTRNGSRYEILGWSLVVAVVCASAAWGVSRLGLRVRVPPALRMIGRPPFRLKSRTVIHDLAAVVLDAAAGPDQQLGVEAAAAKRRQIPSAGR